MASVEPNNSPLIIGVVDVGETATAEALLSPPFCGICGKPVSQVEHVATVRTELRPVAPGQAAMGLRAIAKPYYYANPAAEVLERAQEGDLWTLDVKGVCAVGHTWKAKVWSVIHEGATD